MRLSFIALLLLAAGTVVPVGAQTTLTNWQGPVIFAAFGAQGLKQGIPAGMQQEKIPLQHSDAMQLLAQLTKSQDGSKPLVALPGAIKSDGLSFITLHALSADHKTNILVAVGTPAALAELKRVVALLDVERPQIKLTLVLLRFTYLADSTWDMEKVSDSIVTTLNNIPAVISLRNDSPFASQDYTIRLTPRVNGDNTITLMGQMNVPFPIQKGVIYIPFEPRSSLKVALQPSVQQASSVARIIEPGKKIILGGATDAPDADIRQKVALGQIPTGGKIPFTAYFLQVSATVEKPKK